MTDPVIERLQVPPVPLEAGSLGQWAVTFSQSLVAGFQQHGFAINQIREAQVALFDFGNWVIDDDIKADGSDNFFLQWRPPVEIVNDPNGPFTNPTFTGTRLFATPTGLGVNTETLELTEAFRVDSMRQGGFLMPRLSLDDRDSMGLKNAGLMIWNSDQARPEWWDGQKWIFGLLSPSETAEGGVNQGPTLAAPFCVLCDPGLGSGPVCVLKVDDVTCNTYLPTRPVTENTLENFEAMPNPGFENGSEGWTLGTTGVISSELPRTGLASLKYTPQSSGGPGPVSSLIPVLPGDTITAKVWIRGAPGSSAAGNMWVAVQFFAPDGVTAVSGDALVSSSSMFIQEWEESIRVVTAPTGAGFIRWRISAFFSLNGVVFLDDFSLTITRGEQPVVTKTDSFRLGVGGLPKERFHVMGLDTGGRVSARLENQSTASGASRSTSFRFGGDDSEWSIGNDLNQNGEHNFFIKDETNNITRLFIDNTATPINSKRFSFSFGDASPSSLVTLQLPAEVLQVSLEITTPFNGTNPSLELGTPSAPSLLMSVSQNAPGVIGIYETSPRVDLVAGDVIQLTITPGSGATQGAGQLIFLLV